MEAKVVEPNRGFEPKMAYPQYILKYSNNTVIDTDTWIQLQEYVLEKLNSPVSGPNAEVQKHWNAILAGKVPFGIRIVKPVFYEYDERSSESKTVCLDSCDECPDACVYKKAD